MRPVRQRVEAQLRARGLRAQAARTNGKCAQPCSAAAPNANGWYSLQAFGARTQYEPPRWLCECTKSRLSSHTAKRRSYSCAAQGDQAQAQGVHRVAEHAARLECAPARPPRTPSQSSSPIRQTRSAGSPALALCVTRGAAASTSHVISSVVSSPWCRGVLQARALAHSKAPTWCLRVSRVRQFTCGGPERDSRHHAVAATIPQSSTARSAARAIVIAMQDKVLIRQPRQRRPLCEHEWQLQKI